MIIRVEQNGDELTLAVPKEFNIALGAEFEVDLREDGSILYRPMHPNPFEGNWFNKDMQQEDVMEDSEVLANEWE